MKILIAEDDHASLLLLKIMLQRWNYELITTTDGEAAWKEIEKLEPPYIALLDWMMPKIDGLELCRRIREMAVDQPIYTILLTARATKADIARGLDEGADDYITKPFDPLELRSRIEAGQRILNLRLALSEKIDSLEEALTRIKVLQGLLQICSYCKKIKDDQGQWQETEKYISAHSESKFSHCICPNCYDKHIEPNLES